MKRIVFFLLAQLVLQIAHSSDTIYFKNNKLALKGYKKIFYKLIILHPKINSPLERGLLRHYLSGSGTVFQLSDLDFMQLLKIASLDTDATCTPLEKSNSYCIKRVSLINDPYFGWGLGTVTFIFQQQQLVSFFDVYDFNKKKTGERKRNLEFLTRLFELIAPKSAKSFIVTYAKDAYYEN